MSRCLLAAGNNRNAKMVWNTGFGADEMLVDTAECAVAQTWQAEASF